MSAFGQILTSTYLLDPPAGKTNGAIPLTFDQPSCAIPSAWTKTSCLCTRASPPRYDERHPLGDALEFIMEQLARLATRTDVARADVARAGVWTALALAALAIVVVETFWRVSACGGS